MKKLAVIGCGLRADCYLHELRNILGKQCNLVALADPNPDAIDIYMKNYCNSQTKTFRSGPELLKNMEGQMDAVIIASPNSMHLESIIPALKMNIAILLEKPVATSVEDCDRLWQEYTDAGKPPLALGFVLRHTNFYQKIKQLIEGDSLGQILLIDATEMIDAPLAALFMREWRRHTKMAGPLSTEKCCHDIDLLNWFASASPVKISSFGCRSRFVPKPEASTHCKDCKLKDQCRYAIDNISPYLINLARKEQIGTLLSDDNDLCVFNSDKDIWDHQVVNIEYANGILASLAVCMDQPRTTRTIRICGTKGQVVGDIGADILEVHYHSKTSSDGENIERIKIEHDDSGHHGGDSIITKEFLAVMNGKAVPLAGIREGIEACLLTLAAEQSLNERRVVEMEKNIEEYLSNMLNEISEFVDVR